MADRREVDAELVAAAGQRREPQARRRGLARGDLPVGERRACRPASPSAAAGSASRQASGRSMQPHSPSTRAGDARDVGLRTAGGARTASRGGAGRARVRAKTMTPEVSRSRRCTRRDLGEGGAKPRLDAVLRARRLGRDREQARGLLARRGGGRRRGGARSRASGRKRGGVSRASRRARRGGRRSSRPWCRRRAAALHQRQQRGRELLAELDAPLVEAVDPPDHALDEHPVLVERDDAAERAPGRASDRSAWSRGGCRGRPCAGRGPGPSPSLSASSRVRPFISASDWARQLASSSSWWCSSAGSWP